MDAHKIDADFAKSFMTLAGGILTLSAVALNIVSAKLQKAKTAGARERVIAITIGTAALLFSLAGMITLLAIGRSLIVVGLFCMVGVLVSILYLRCSGLPSRFETFILVVSICSVFFFVTLYFFDRILGLVEMLTALVAKLDSVPKNP